MRIPVRWADTAWSRSSLALLVALVLSLSASCGVPQGEHGLADFSPEPDLVRAQSAPAESAGDFEVQESLDGMPVGAPKARPEQARLRVYSAELELVVGRVEEARSRILSLAEETGGYVESSGEDFVIIRVPAEAFEGAVDSLGRLGAVRSRVVSTTDVTEQFSDLQRRIALARTTRERLYRLLERTQDNDERVRILREIRRLTEEIETLQSELESLDEAVRYSRITAYLISRIEEVEDQRTTIPFPWIAWLDPLERTTGPAARDIILDLPDDYGVFTRDRFVRAETPEGTQLRIGAVENEPRGDTEFWDEALRFHLGKLYLVEARIDTPAFRGVLFQAKSMDPFYYLVAVAVRDREVVVAEAFFPDAAAAEARLDEIVEVLEGAEL